MFGKRFNLLTFAGIKIGIDISWFFIALLISWTLASGYFPHYFPHLSTLTYWLMGISGMLGLFVCIVLHELGHALVARHFQVPTSQITLFLFGGVAEINKDPPSAKAEFFVAVAGPLVSVALVGLLYFLTKVGHSLDWPTEITAVTGYLALINAIIVAFNLIPAFPLDGGRIFRALLWWWKKNLKMATNVATRIGSGFGFLLIFLGIISFITGNFLGGIWLFILGLFLQRAASSARAQFFIGKELAGEKVSKFMKSNPIVVDPDLSVQAFVDEYVYESHHQLYPVVQHDSLVGYISLREVKTIPKTQWKKTSIKNAMVLRKDFRSISPDSSALEAYNLMNQENTSALLVTSGDTLMGILTAEDLFKRIALKLELEEKR